MSFPAFNKSEVISPEKFEYFQNWLTEILGLFLPIGTLAIKQTAAIAPAEAPQILLKVIFGM